MLNPLNILSKFFKSSNQKELERLNKLAIKINELEEQTLKLEDKDFPLKTNEFIEKIKNGTSLENILPEAFALAREASRRVTKSAILMFKLLVELFFMKIK